MNLCPTSTSSCFRSFGSEIGADIAIVPFAVLKQTLHHPLTDLGLERFLADWRKTNQKI
jgi:transaldolase